MSLSTITISAIDYVSYASVAEADAYLAVDPIRGVAWSALTADQKGLYLVSATRRLDLLNWAGQKTGSYSTQVNAWPRTNVQYADGSSVSTTEVPQEVEDATILLAGSILLDSTAAAAGTSGSNVKRQKAGSVEIERFRPTTGKALQDETAYALIAQFFTGGVSSTVGAFASGSDQSSSFSDDQMELGFNEGLS